jgi:hypothetical protein
MDGRGVSRLAREFITALCQFPVLFLSPPVESYHVQISWEQFKAGQVLRNGIIGMWPVHPGRKKPYSNKLTCKKLKTWPRPSVRLAIAEKPPAAH